MSIYQTHESEELKSKAEKEHDQTLLPCTESEITRKLDILRECYVQGSHTSMEAIESQTEPAKQTQISLAKTNRNIQKNSMNNHRFCIFLNTFSNFIHVHYISFVTV